MKNFTATKNPRNLCALELTAAKKLWKSVENHTSHPWKSELNFTAAKNLWKSVENHTSNPWKSVLNSPTPQPTKIHLHIRKNFRNFAHGKHLVTI